MHGITTFKMEIVIISESFLFGRENQINEKGLRTAQKVLQNIIFMSCPDVKVFKHISSR